MKLTSYRRNGKDSYGIVTDAGVIDLGARLGAKYPDLKALIAGDALGEAQAIARQARADADLQAVSLLPVIPNPAKILCIGLNYEEHRVETQRERTDHPTVFLRLSESQTGHNQPLLCPRESTSLDYEGEIAVIIGKPGRRIAEADAHAHIAGYSCYNDGSVRDWQRHTSQFTPGKNFAATGGFGPWMVSADEIAPGAVMSLTTRLNGQVMQHATTDMMIFSIPRLIAYCSTFTPLVSGDVIVTGTPGGVGARRNPPVFMKAGDVVEVEVDRIGCLRNVIARD
jgi:2-keto-4-pentenoate hydratase/2-oxohepta-3-ene-1,7-dioic acid hydratase in catechol pathway